MSCEWGRLLWQIIWKGAGMTDREAKAWAAKEEAERDLRREKAKVSWLCRELAFRDAGEPFPPCHRSAEAWEELADLYGNGR